MNSDISKTELLECFDKDFNVFVEFGREYGVEALEAMLQKLGGTKPHVPMADSFWAKLKKAVRDEEMRARFTGNNIEQLGIDYELDPRQVRNIVTSRSMLYKRPRQPGTSVTLQRENYDACVSLAEDLEMPIKTVANAIMESALRSDAVIASARKQLCAQIQLETETQRTTADAA